MKYILALDIGIASVGWAILDKESETVIEAGSNIFPEASAADNQLRRDMRGAKRNNRRLKTRINDFIKLWENNNLSIPQFKSTEIVGLKVRAITEEITLDELYLILYSYLKHRGISYLEDALDDTVSGSSAYANGLKLNAKELETHYPCEIQQERLNTIGKYRGQSQIINDNGEVLDLSNVFTIGAYRKEIQRVFEIQKKYHPELTDEFCDGYMLIFNRKRKYYEGPGNEKSRTDYGRFTTKLDANGNYITEDNIFEKLIGKCSVYPDELRAAAASYTAQEYNLLNDLNNLTINGRKLEENEKHEIVERIKSSNTINMRKIISDCMGENIDDFAGARIDKSGKEIFHKFEVYNKMRKALLEIGIDISNYSREELDEIGYIMTINTDKEAMMEAFQKSWIDLSDDVKQCLINMRKTNGALFNKWQSFSLKIMNELIPEMYAQPKEQMTLLTEMGVTKGTQEEFAGLKYIPVDVVSEDIFNPVVRRSVRISFKILNAVLKKYKALDTIVIEMPRDRNSEEQKKRINDSQKLNEKEMEYIEKKLAVTYGIKLSPSDFSSQKQLSLKLKLWNEQDGICLYSGKTIDPNDIINNPQLFEIDHIIPRSISFDDARSNKVLVYRSENQKKGNQTPYYYLTHSHSEWSFEQYKATVMNLSKKKEYAISRKKIQNLLYKINKLDIRTKEGIKVFAKLAFSKKDSDRERLLVYLNDRRTFDDLCKIYEDYSDAANPFVQYEKETGDIVRKYSKKHNGPRIDKLKYKDGEVGACIDISHKYGFEKGSKKVILESLVPYRMDVYYKEENHSYYLVGVKQSDIKFEKGRNVIDEEAYARILVNEKMIQPGQSRADLENLGFKFKLSFYKNDIIEYEKDGKIYTERLVSRTMPKQRNYIETKPINRDKHEDSKDGRKIIGLSKTKLVKKIRTDILGNKYSCSEEKFTSFC